MLINIISSTSWTLHWFDLTWVSWASGLACCWFDFLVHKGLFSSPCERWVQTHIQCCYSPCVQSLVSVYVPMFKFWSIGSHTIVWTHESAAYTRSALEDGVWLPDCSGRAIETCHKHNLFPPQEGTVPWWKEERRRSSLSPSVVGWVGGEAVAWYLLVSALVVGFTVWWVDQRSG